MGSFTLLHTYKASPSDIRSYLLENLSLEWDMKALIVISHGKIR